MVTEDYKVLFARYLSELHDDKGVSLRKISEKTGIGYDRIKQIRKGKSSGRMEDVHKLLQAYPELKQDETKEPTIKEEIDQLRAEFEERISKIERMMLHFSLEQQSKLREEFKELEKRIEEMKKEIGK